MYRIYSYENAGIMHLITFLQGFLTVTNFYMFCLIIQENMADSQIQTQTQTQTHITHSCGSGYDWFDYLQAEYKCIDIMEPIAEVPKPTKRPTCKPSPTTPTKPPPEEDEDAVTGGNP